MGWQDSQFCLFYYLQESWLQFWNSKKTKVHVCMRAHLSFWGSMSGIRVLAWDVGVWGSGVQFGGVVVYCCASGKVTGFSLNFRVLGIRAWGLEFEGVGFMGLGLQV